MQGKPVATRSRHRSRTRVLEYLDVVAARAAGRKLHQPHLIVVNPVVWRTRDLRCVIALVVNAKVHLATIHLRRQKHRDRLPGHQIHCIPGAARARGMRATERRIQIRHAQGRCHRRRRTRLRQIVSHRQSRIGT